jgi:hypothetical protein
MSEQLTERAKREEAVAAERGKRDEAVAAERAERAEAVAAERVERARRDQKADELAVVRGALSNTSEVLRQKNIDYLRIKGTVDIRSAMGESR